MSYSATITFGELQPERLYKVSAPSTVQVFYSGKKVFGSGAIGYFISNDTNQLVVTSSSAISGKIYLTEIVRSYHEAYDGTGGVWAFQKNLDRWTSRYSYRPEWYGMVGGRLVSFKSGKPYMHIAPDPSAQFYPVERYFSPANDFYGNGTDDSVLVFVHNEAAVQPNVYTSVGVTNTGNTGEDMSIHVRTGDYRPQSSSLVNDSVDPYDNLPQNRNGDFRMREDMIYAAIKRDRLSPNISGSPDEKELKGDKMRGNYGLFQITWKQKANIVRLLKLAEVTFTPSRGHRVE